MVVVSHGATIEALYTRACPSGDCRGKVLNASVNVFHLSDDQDEWSIKSWGNVSHLNQTGFLESGFGGGGKFWIVPSDKSINERYKKKIACFKHNDLLFQIQFNATFSYDQHL